MWRESPPPGSPEVGGADLPPPGGGEKKVEMTLRTDHAAGGVFVAFGLVILAISGDLPFGTLSFPGAGMMPKLTAGALMFFGLMLIVRARESSPLASIARGDFWHAARVTAITATAIALYRSLADGTL